MMFILIHCRVNGYATGQVKCPDPIEYPNCADNWHFNDAYAMFLMANNITSRRLAHVTHRANAHEMWRDLEAWYEPKAPLMSYVRKLRTKAQEGDNVIDHLNKLLWNRQQVSIIANN
jgi:hypothetical protein